MKPLSKVMLIDSQVAGISGDMLLGALIDAGANVLEIQETIGLIPKYFPRCKSLQLTATEAKKHGFRSCSAHFAISEEEEETQASELIHAIEEIANASKLSEAAASFARASIRTLAEAEGKLHGVTIQEVHLHEAGSTDTLADILGVAGACDSLGIFDGEIYSTPVAVGSGSMTFSHGTVTTPAPAVLDIATRNGIPIVGGPEPGELTTPTGISMLAALTKKFLTTYPPMIPRKTGYGAGRKELANTPNLLRVVIGDGIPAGSETVEVLETNLDDVPGEIVAHALQRILDAGAKDAWTTPATFKKSRPGHVLHAICEPGNAAGIAEIMFQETGTLGVRFQQWNRFTLQRDIEKLKLHVAGREFEVRIKVARDASGKIVRRKPEFDDIREIAEALSTTAREVSDLVLREISRLEDKRKGGA
jgi:uncharacterized protein (TIGR00299 family) protein